MTTLLTEPAIVPAGLEPESIDLWGWAESIDPADGPRAAEAQDAVAALLFGHLVDRTDGIVEHYRSDLYRDAQKLQQHLTGPGRFWYVARTWGTNLMWEDEPGSAACLADLLRSRSHDEQARAWWVELTETNRRWSATITPIATNQEG